MMSPNPVKQKRASRKLLSLHFGQLGEVITHSEMQVLHPIRLRQHGATTGLAITSESEFKSDRSFIIIRSLSSWHSTSYYFVL